MTKSWDIGKECATAKAGSWELSLNPLAPKQGLQLSKSGTQTWEVLSVEAVPAHALKAEEAYVRGDDLIVRFDQSDEDNFAFQLDFRVLPDAREQVEMGVELWLSVQTDDLESEPTLKVGSHSPTGQYWDILDHGKVLGDSKDINADSSPAALVCIADKQTGVWLIEFGDQRHADLLSSPGESEQRIELFGHFMEKGVIRRARMRFFLIEGEVEDQLLKELYQEFSESPLPLTA